MNISKIRVTYADTDQMGMVYYANYLKFFEIGRTEWMREVGLKYKKIEEIGYYFPVVYSECKYLAPAKYDDFISIETKLIEITAVTVTFSYLVKLKDKILVTGKTRHPFVNRVLKPVRFTKDIRELMEKHLES